MNKGLLSGPSLDPKKNFTVVCPKHALNEDAPPPKRKVSRKINDADDDEYQEEYDDSEEDVMYCYCSGSGDGMMIECSSGITCNGWVHIDCEGLNKVRCVLSLLYMIYIIYEINYSS